MPPRGYNVKSVDHHFSSFLPLFIIMFVIYAMSYLFYYIYLESSLEVADGGTKLAILAILEISSNHSGSLSLPAVHLVEFL